MIHFNNMTMTMFVDQQLVHKLNEEMAYYYYIDTTIIFILHNPLGLEGECQLQGISVIQACRSLV